MNEISPMVNEIVSSTMPQTDPEGLARRALAAADDSVKDRKIKEMWKAAEGFESIFLHLMLKSMRETAMNISASDDETPSMFEDSNAMKLVRGLHDQELAESLSKSHRFGLSKQIFDWMARSQPDLKQVSTPANSALNSYRAVKTLGNDVESANLADHE